MIPPLRNTSRPVAIFAGIVLLLGFVALLTTTFKGLSSSSGNETESTPTESIAGPSAAIQSADPGASRDSQAAAQETQNTQVVPELEEGPKAVREYASPFIARALAEVVELLNTDQHAAAMEVLEPLLSGDMLAQMTPFERSRLYLLSFNLNMQAGSYEAATADIQAALETGGLSAEESNRLEYQVGQLYVQMEDYEKAADSLEYWVARQEGKANAAAYYLLSASYYYQQKFDEAQNHMETLMKMPGEKQEPWYQMMTALYLQAEDYESAQPILETMVALYDKDSYRQQLNEVRARTAGR